MNENQKKKLTIFGKILMIISLLLIFVNVLITFNVINMTDRNYHTNTLCRKIKNGLVRAHSNYTSYNISKTLSNIFLLYAIKPTSLE